MKYFKKPFIVSILIILVYLLLLFSGNLDIARLKVQDYFLRFKYRFSKTTKEIDNIVIVAIDDNAYYKYDEKWPWGREIFAGLIYNITRDSPKIVGLNLGFLGRSGETEVGDFVLREAFKDAGNVISASYFGNDGQYFTPSSYFINSLKGYGFTNKPLDSDNVVRKTRLFAKNALGNIVDYSFDLKLICAYYGLPIDNIVHNDNKLVLQRKGSKKKDIVIPFDKNGLCVLNYSGEIKDFKIMPILDVINNQAGDDVFKDRIVLVGTTGKIFHDQNMTPLGEMPGVVIMANSILMILNQDYIFELPRYLNILFFICSIIIIGIWFERVRILKGFVIMLTVIAGYFAASLLLVINNYFWDFLSIPMFAIISFISFETVGYGALLMESIKLRNIAIMDSLTKLPIRRYFLIKLQNLLKKAAKEKQDLSVVLLSINNLDGLISSLGLEGSDLIIKMVAERIKINSRKAERVDFIARYGECDFSVILKNTPERGAVKYVNRIKDILEQEMATDRGNRFRVIISAGIVSYKLLPYSSAEAFMEGVERTLKRAKVSKEKVLLFNKEIDEIAGEELKLTKETEEGKLGFVGKELESKNKELREMLNKLRLAHIDIVKNERLSAVGKLASTIHHELNNPLSALRSCLQNVYKNLEKGIDYSSIQKNTEMVSMALEEIQRMFEMNKNLKDIYKQPHLELSPVDVNKILEEILTILNEQFQIHKIKLIKDFQDDIPNIEANKPELKQTFLNILINAQDSMPSGGEIRITTKVIDEGNNKMLEIQMADTGCGIPKEILETIFDAFFTTKEEGKGTGLGLYVTKQIIEKYNGGIEVKSEVNKGTTFYIKFPIY